jgi:hypothetical protein
MREDLRSAWESAKGNRQADLYNRYPKPEDIEPHLLDDEKVIMLLKGNIQPGRMDTFKDVTFHGGVGTLVLSDKRVHYFSRGLVKSFTNSHESFEFSKITGVELRKNLAFGQMIYITRAENSDSWTQLNKDEAQVFVSALQKQISASAQPTQTAIDPLDQIKKLKDLLDLGAISQSEFDEKKAQLMGKI